MCVEDGREESVRVKDKRDESVSVCEGVMDREREREWENGKMQMSGNWHGQK